MKATYMLVALLLCCGCLIACIAQSGVHARVTTEQTSSEQRKSSLQLTISVISQKYCAGDGELDGLRMNLLLHYTNTGQQPLILYKGSNLVSRLMVSHTPEDAAARRFEVNALLTQVTDGSKVKVETTTPGALFVILPPGASYDTEESVSVFAVRDDASRIEGAIGSGEHVLQVEVPTWPASNDLAKKLHDLWQRSGCLWSGKSGGKISKYWGQSTPSCVVASTSSAKQFSFMG